MGVLTTFLKVLSGIFNVLPLAISIAETIAKLFKPGQKTGAEKLAAVKAVVRNALVAWDSSAGRKSWTRSCSTRGSRKSPTAR